MKHINMTKLIVWALFLGVVLVMGCGQPAGSRPLVPAHAENNPASLDRDRLLDLLEGVVSPPVITSHRQNEQVDGQTEHQLIFIEGYSEPDNRLEVKVNGIVKADSIKAQRDGFFKTADGVEIVAGKNRIQVSAISPSGEKSRPTVFEVFLNVPQRVEFTIYDDAQNLKEIFEIYFLKEGDPLVYITGRYESAAEIFVQVNDRVVQEGATDAAGSFAFDDIRLRKGENEIAVWGKTQEQKISQPVYAHVLVTRDTVSPNPSSLKGYSDDFGNHITWTTSVDPNFYSYKLVRVQDPCLNPQYPDHDVIASFSERETGSFTDEDIKEGRSYYYTLWTLDKAGNAISSNVLALPSPVYAIHMERMPPFEDHTVGRRQWYYQYFRISNTGNVTVDLQPIMVWIKLSPEPREQDLFPLWETHIWDADSGQYYYSNERIEDTIIPDYWAIDAITQEGEIYEYVVDENDQDEGNDQDEEDHETVDEQEREVRQVRDIVTRKTHRREGKRVMETTTRTVDVETGEVLAVETTQTLVEPERIGSLIQGLEPGHSVEVAVKIQNITAAAGDQITVHFHFAPVDCSGYFFTDEEVSTQDITVISTGRN